MTIPAEVWDRVRQRAAFACEYCRVTEADSGGALTIDHYHPQSRGGSDELDNLLYCCYRCNLYKAAYWPDDPGASLLWNPRREPMSNHLLALADGRLHPLTPVGQFTLHRLRLNRPELIAYRKKSLAQAEVAAALKEFKVLLESFFHLQERMESALKEHSDLLKEKRTLLTHLGPQKNGSNGLAH